MNLENYQLYLRQSFATIKTTLTQSYISITNNIVQLSTISMVILGNFKDNYDAALTTATQSMGFALSVQLNLV